MLKYFGGCWKMFREIKSLADDHFIGIVNEAVASYHPWNNQTDQQVDTSSSDNRETGEQWLLYRESGKLENYDFPGASGQFTRQYLYKFPSLDSAVSNELKVFHCSKTSMKAEDVDPLNSEYDPTAFKEGDFFHDLTFPQGVDWESLPRQGNMEKREPVTAAGHHLCGRDTYKGMFQIYSVDNFKTVWNVTGPEKAYQIVSIYTRLS